MIVSVYVCKYLCVFPSQLWETRTLLLFVSAVRSFSAIYYCACLSNWLLKQARRRQQRLRIAVERKWWTTLRTRSWRAGVRGHLDGRYRSWSTYHRQIDGRKKLYTDNGLTLGVTADFVVGAIAAVANTAIVLSEI